MRWGIRFTLLAAVLALAVPAGGGVAASAPSYEEGPIYQPAPPPRAPGIRFAGLRLNRHSGTAIVFVRVPGPGRAIVHGRGVRRLVRVVGQARRLALPVRPKVRLMRYLERHGKGRIRVLVTFKPDDASEATTIERPVVLKRRP